MAAQPTDLPAITRRDPVTVEASYRVARGPPPPSAQEAAHIHSRIGLERAERDRRALTHGNLLMERIEFGEVEYSLIFAGPECQLHRILGARRIRRNRQQYA